MKHLTVSQLLEQRGRLLASQSFGPQFSKTIENKIKNIDRELQLRVI